MEKVVYKLKMLQCSALFWFWLSNYIYTINIQSDTSQSESDTDVEGGLDTSEYTLSLEDTSSM